MRSYNDDNDNSATNNCCFINSCYCYLNCWKTNSHWFKMDKELMAHLMILWRHSTTPNPLTSCQRFTAQQGAMRHFGLGTLFCAMILCCTIPLRYLLSIWLNLKRRKSAWNAFLQLFCRTALHAISSDWFTRANSVYTKELCLPSSL